MQEIYEGDAVRIRYGFDESVYEATARITWHNASCSFAALNITSALPHIEPLHHENEVIGNIFENPELLN